MKMYYTVAHLSTRVTERLCFHPLISVIRFLDDCAAETAPGLPGEFYSSSGHLRSESSSIIFTRNPSLAVPAHLIFRFACVPEDYLFVILVPPSNAVKIDWARSARLHLMIFVDIPFFTQFDLSKKLL